MSIWFEWIRMRSRLAEVKVSLERLAQAAKTVGRKMIFMEVCGTHTMSAFRSGLHSLLPSNVTLLSGPGCPVCVTAQGDIDLLIQLALRQDRPMTICTYGDMIRVPGRDGSLEKARSCGADIRVIYSALDAVRLAQRLPEREVVLAAVGFETTAPGTAAAISEAKRLGVKNFSALASHKRVLPAMMALLDAGEVRLDGFMCPGHVSAVMGWELYRPIVEKHGMPCVVAGFEEHCMAAALALLAEMVRDGRKELINAYPEVVAPQGNMRAQELMDEVFAVGDVRWRALGTIPGSGMIIRKEYADFDAAVRFNLGMPEDHEPAGCICGKVITGMATPHECKLFGTACTPINPIGPCMVSSEGTCQAWFKYHRVGVKRANLETCTTKGVA